jgi:predicted transcriptional regulator
MRAAMSAANVKQQLHEIVDQLPDNVTWDEVAYRVEVRASIERGLADVEAGRTFTTEEVRKHFGLE